MDIAWKSSTFITWPWPLPFPICPPTRESVCLLVSHLCCFSQTCWKSLTSLPWVSWEGLSACLPCGKDPRALEPSPLSEVHNLSCTSDISWLRDVYSKSGDDPHCRPCRHSQGLKIREYQDTLCSTVYLLLPSAGHLNRLNCLNEQSLLHLNTNGTTLLQALSAFL